MHGILSLPYHQTIIICVVRFYCEDDPMAADSILNGYSRHREVAAAIWSGLVTVSVLQISQRQRRQRC